MVTEIAVPLILLACAFLAGVISGSYLRDRQLDKQEQPFVPYQPKPLTLPTVITLRHVRIRTKKKCANKTTITPGELHKPKPNGQVKYF